MKEYPSIERIPRYGKSVYVFDKKDGSNIRAEWSRKKGFWKFGRRHGLLDHSTPILLRAPDLILEKYNDSLSEIFRKMQLQKAVAFLEFWGPSSFAGFHDENENQTVTLFDVAADQKGIIHPRDFVKNFEGVETAELLYHGSFTRDLEQQIRGGHFPGVSFEGVVCKGGFASPGLPLMFKVKTDAWLEKLHAHCAGNTKLFESLL